MAGFRQISPEELLFEQPSVVSPGGCVAIHPDYLGCSCKLEFSWIRRTVTLFVRVIIQLRLCGYRRRRVRGYQSR